MKHAGVRPLYTQEERDEVPFDQRHYTCQSCGKGHPDPGLFKMIVSLGIGFVVCRECLSE